jgi:uncharacterized protein YacL
MSLVRPLMITHVNVVPMDSERVVQDQSVVIDDGLIRTVTRAGYLDGVPQGALARLAQVAEDARDFAAHARAPNTLKAYRID